jgi:hypothetical protein
MRITKTGKLFRTSELVSSELLTSVFAARIVSWRLTRHCGACECCSFVSQPKRAVAKSISTR